MLTMIKMLPFLFTIVCLAGVSPALCSTDTPLSLTTAKERVTGEFERLDFALKQAAETLGTSGLTGDRARSSLRDLCSGFSYAVDCSAVDAKGRMITVEPAPYRKFEGSDISNQAQVEKVMASRRPVLSGIFRAVEGFEAADAEYPVTAPDGKFLGSVSILFSPARLLGDIIRPLTAGTPFDIWVMDNTGRILYDIDTPQIGLNLFTSPLYRPYGRLVRLGRRIAAQREGSGVYQFKAQKSRKVVAKNAYWQTVSLYGTEWRLIGIHVEHDASGKRTGHVPPATTPEQRLEAFAKEQPLIAALEKSDTRTGMDLFRNFYEETPDIYSVQWIDEKGINRFGYPADNSLKDYDYHSGRAASDSEMLRILGEKKPAVMEAPLFEGRTGVFTFKPLFSGEKYLGMMYIIRVKQAVSGQSKP
jgi:hypothetical protein